MKKALIIALALIIVGAVIFGIAMKINGFDFLSLSTENISKTAADFSDEFSAVDITNTSGEIQIRRSSDGYCHVILIEDENIARNAEIIGGVLTITQQQKRSDLPFIGVALDDGPDIAVYLPGEKYDSLKITSTSGDISLEGLPDIAYIELIATSGEIEVGGVRAGTLNAGTTSGSIELEEISADTLSLSVTSGDIETDDVVISGRADIGTTSGSIELEDFDAGSIDVSSTSGSISGTLLSPKRFDVRTSSGSMSIPVSDPNGGECIASSVSGSIKISVK